VSPPTSIIVIIAVIVIVTGKTVLYSIVTLLVSVKYPVSFPGDKNEHFKFSSVLVCNNKYWAFFTVFFFRCSKCDIYFGLICL